MVGIVELLHVEVSVLYFDNCALVVVHVTVVGSTEHSDNCREVFSTIPFMKFIPVLLDFMSSYNTDNLIFVDKFVCRFLSIH